MARTDAHVNGGLAGGHRAGADTFGVAMKVIRFLPRSLRQVFTGDLIRQSSGKLWICRWMLRA
jgi:hypothetical protein